MLILSRRGTFGDRPGSGKVLAAPGSPCQLHAMNDEILDQSGQCDCGAVTLAINGRIVSMFLCSCDNCQRATGGGHSSVALLPADAVRIDGATTAFSRPADSGATFTRHFCPRCGTTLYAHSSRAPTLRIVPVGIFAGHNDWFRPNQLLFARSHRAWDLIPDQLPQHQTYRDGGRI